MEKFSEFEIRSHNIDIKNNKNREDKKGYGIETYLCIKKKNDYFRG